MIQMTTSIEGITDLQDAINRRIAVLRQTPKYVVTAAAINVMKSLRARTIARRTNRLPVKESQSAKKAKRRRDGKKIYYVERYKKDDTLKKFVIFASSLSEAKQSPTARMRYHKLAKASWGWAMQKIGTKEGVNDVGSNASITARTVRVMVDGKPADFAITVTNEIDYIRKAFSGGSGDAVINEALKSAARKMMGDIQHRIGMAGAGRFAR